MRREITGSKVAVIGGSIAGCAAAIALTRAGCEVTVFERTRGTLRDRGFGIGIPPPVLSTLVEADYVDSSIPVVRGRERVFIIRDHDPMRGRILWRQPLPVNFTNWSVLWQSLRKRVTDESYRGGTTAAIVGTESGGVMVSLGAPRAVRFDLVVGADGYASTVRQRIAPESWPTLPGYGLWRGTYPEELMPDGVPRDLEHAGTTVCFRGGHGMIYLIPDHRNSSRRLVNWAIYINPPRALTNPALIPPGRVPRDLLDLMNRVVTEAFPRLWADVVLRTPTDHISVQPVFDAAAPRYVSGRIVLAGDAGTTARPHTGSGAAKALRDALALEGACGRFPDWSSALAEYDRDRCAQGNALVALGRSLGHAQVEHTPDWGSMSEADFLAWWMNAASGRASLYE